MAQEIERKFLVKDDSWRQSVTESSRITQGYLTGVGTTLRVRLRDGQAFLTIKGKARGIVRSEFEYNIPFDEAQEMLDTLSLYPPVDKIRHIVPAGNGLFWEIDEYLGENAPLFTAEIELPQCDTVFDIPSWLGKDVSSDNRYTNRSLSRAPYSQWPPEEEPRP
ncbi:MAG: CYTH domain-containing protein [Lentisphaerae bacterium]|nr:CYTH domain-containing protein [Lentisphaerota bacterium]